LVALVEQATRLDLEVAVLQLKVLSCLLGIDFTTIREDTIVRTFKADCTSVVTLVAKFAAVTFVVTIAFAIAIVTTSFFGALTTIIRLEALMEPSHIGFKSDFRSFCSACY
jgi:hypothetical protein